MPSEVSSMLRDDTARVDDHPQLRDVNDEHQASLSHVERICKTIADWTGAPVALLLAIVFQIGWVVVGSMSHWDPFPFVFLLTVSNILQLVLIFVIAVAEKQSSQHAELRAEIDHEHIARLLHHQELQEDLLLRLASQTQVDVRDIKDAISRLCSAA
jgi:uncharacterized membrane protein